MFSDTVTMFNCVENKSQKKVYWFPTVLNNVEVQQNGIIRNEKGRLIARLVDGIDFEGEHIAGVKVEKQNKFIATDFEKVKTAIFILAQAIEDGSIQGVCHDVTEALYSDSKIVAPTKTDK